MLFAVALRLVTDSGHDAEPAYTVLKLVLLLAVPALVFRLSRHGATRREPVRERTEVWHRYGPVVPVVPVAAWLVLYAGPFARPLWPILTVHGAINAAPILLDML
ncbi:hypothetical protein [Planomonospora parontospora]|uniref:hypothetical protein n=1 Tax=Planomonospora parontospora TaxID=58119 RepID=UPI001671883B|nr:hypothetical protein [Planomonospora parontospora]